MGVARPTSHKRVKQRRHVQTWRADGKHQSTMNQIQIEEALSQVTTAPRRSLVTPESQVPTPCARNCGGGLDLRVAWGGGRGGDCVVCAAPRGPAAAAMVKRAEHLYIVVLHPNPYPATLCLPSSGFVI